MASRIVYTCRRWCQLSFREQLVTLEMAMLVATVSLVLRFFGFARTYRLLRLVQASPASADTPREVASQHVTAMVRVARHAAWAGRCLSRALALRYALARRGVPAQVHVGVNASRELFRAHAWVVSDGVALGERADVIASFAGRFVLA